MKELHPKAYDLLSRVRVPAPLYTFPEFGYPVLGYEAMEIAGGEKENEVIEASSCRCGGIMMIGV